MPLSYKHLLHCTLCLNMGLSEVKQDYLLKKLILKSFKVNIGIGLKKVDQEQNGTLMDQMNLSGIFLRESNVDH